MDQNARQNTSPPEDAPPPKNIRRGSLWAGLGLSWIWFVFCVWARFGGGSGIFASLCAPAVASAAFFLGGKPRTACGILLGLVSVLALVALLIFFTLLHGGH